MSKFDGKAFGEEIVSATKDFIGKALQPIRDRLKALEDAMAAPPDILGAVNQIIAEREKDWSIANIDARGADRDSLANLERMIKEINDSIEQRAIAAMPQPEPDVELIKGLVADAVAAMSQPKDGAPGENGKDGIDGKDGADGLNGKDGAPGLDGKDGAPGLDGKDGIDGKDGADGLDGKDGAPGINGKDGAPGLDGKNGSDGLDGKDGVGLAGAMIDRDKHLIVTLTNGEHKDLGEVVGKDGAPGKDGNDGLGFDDLEMIHDGERGFTFRMIRGEKVKEFAFTVPAMIYRGVFKEQDYAKGDTITWGGSLWHCNEATKENPNQNHDAWTLVAKKGSDGKDGIVKPAKDPAPVKI